MNICKLNRKKYVNKLSLSLASYFVRRTEENYVKSMGR